MFICLVTVLLLIYLSIGPGLGIPRAGSVPFEMAVYPYLPEGASFKLWMAVYTLIFFAIVLWLCFNPGKLVKRIGTFLTPSLLTLIFVMFIVFLFKGKKVINDPFLLNKEIKKGIFGADMKVSLLNDGPVTICIDSKNKE